MRRRMNLRRVSGWLASWKGSEKRRQIKASAILTLKRIAGEVKMIFVVGSRCGESKKAPEGITSGLFLLL
jgi:hypothetical protein